MTGAVVYGAADRVAKTGDTMSGPLTLGGSPPAIVPGATAGQVLTFDGSGNGTPQPFPAAFYSAVDYGGADPTGSVDATFAIVSTFAKAAASAGFGGTSVYLPPGTYKCNNGIPYVDGIELAGTGYQSTVMTVSGSGKYLFNMDPAGTTNSTAHLHNVRIHGITMTATSGSAIFWGSNWVRSWVYDCQFNADLTSRVMHVDMNTGQTNTGGSPDGSGNTYMAEVVFSFNLVNLTGSGSRSAPAWDMQPDGNLRFNDNRWLYNVNWNFTGDITQYNYSLRNVNGPQGSRDNFWVGELFEQPTGGAIFLGSTSGDKIVNCSVEDLASLSVTTSPLISLGTTVGNTASCTSILVSGYSRRGGANVTTDIGLDSGCASITLDALSNVSGGTTLTVDLGSCTGPVDLCGSWTAGAVIKNQAPLASGPSSGLWNYVGSGSNPAFQNSWANSGSGPNLAYRFVGSPPKTVELIGDLTIPVSSPNTLLFTLPSAFRPATQQTLALGIITAGAGGSTQVSTYRVTVGTSGTVTGFGIPTGLASGGRGFLHGFISLDV